MNQPALNRFKNYEVALFHDQQLPVGIKALCDAWGKLLQCEDMSDEEKHARFNISAGELRAMGMPIAENIPDTAWIPRGAWDIKVKAAEAGSDASYSTNINCEITFTQPFKLAAEISTADKTIPQ